MATGMLGGREMRGGRGRGAGGDLRGEPGAGLGRRQDRALGGGIYLLREMGPAAFLLREEQPQAQNFRVYLGDPHSCNCTTFLKRNYLCKHICWVLLKKFKLPRNHEYASRLGLGEREIDEILNGLHQGQRTQLDQSAKVPQKEEDGQIKQKTIDTQDVCPICQEVLLEKKLPVTYCRDGCGNSVHIKCMKIWADHQGDLKADSLVKCPLCRAEFAPLKHILEEFRNSSKLVTAAEKEPLDKHLGIPCNNCRRFPIEGKCYRCTECADYHLCHECFNSCCHPLHLFVFRKKRNQKWRSLERNSQLPLPDGNGRRTDPEKYNEEDMLPLQERPSCTPKHVIKILPLIPVTKNSKLLSPGLQCRLCLKSFCPGQDVRFLPCNHKFHRECIDGWLLYRCNSCPIEGQVIYNPLTWKDTTLNGKINNAESQASITHLEKRTEPELFVPGIRLFFKQPRRENAQKYLHHNSDRLQAETTDPNHGLPLDSKCCFKSGDCNSDFRNDNGSQRFSSYLRDVSFGIFGNRSSERFLPSLAYQNMLFTSKKGPSINGGVCYADPNRKGTKVFPRNSGKLKKTVGAESRRDNLPSVATCPRDLNLVANLASTSHRHLNRSPKPAGKVGLQNHLSKWHKLNPLSPQATEMSFVMKGFPLTRS
ncbi:E3 ubiquitin-protein ligase ZSWIM2 [Tachyglossus aculeatus]|uniref:E3 ubiquitin-protein ligase ZSWIM2 n=1 Tax=Tachyglossus aculeatus TaxID=9261 RepID=UPI0018F765E4|nr:E3 ubiquitin-protein ligase ZSWIM2 [Tachyglossus aculeatus]